MKKYWTILKIGIQESFEYRSEILIYMLAWSVRFLISIMLFLALFREQNTIGNYNAQNIVTYFLVIQILTALNFAKTGIQISDDIQSGDFSNFMIKPISYTLYYLILEFSKNIVRFLIALGIFGVILAFYDPDFFQIELLERLPLILISCIFAYCIASLMNMVIGITAFWITNAKRIIFMYFAIMSIFSGMMIPISLFPDWLQKIVFLTPFPYLLHVPAEMILGHESLPEILKNIVIQILFVIAFYGVIQTLYWFGVKKYEAVGR